jgi:hypothetical protein
MTHRNRVLIHGEGGLAQTTPVPSYGAPPLVTHPVSDVESAAIAESTIRQGEGADGVIHSHHREVPAWLYENRERIRQD